MLERGVVMEFFDLIKYRRSIRKYQSRQIEWEDFVVREIWCWLLWGVDLRPVLWRERKKPLTMKSEKNF